MITDTITINTGTAKYYLIMNDTYRLGEGAFGVVYKAKDQSGRPVAIKIFKSSKDYKTVIETLGTAGNTIGKEIFAYKALGSLQNVVKYIDSALINDTGMIIMEYCDGGSLGGKKFKPKVALEYLAQMANGIHQIHQKGIIHRDLKPDNVMISDGVIKIGDLGLASKKLVNYEYCGTKLYMAPEVRNKQAYSQSADIYSLGLIFVAILTGQNPPFSSSTYGSFGKEISLLINRMLDTKPESRPKAKDIITMANNIINLSHSKSGLDLSTYSEDAYKTYKTPDYEFYKSKYVHSDSGLDLASLVSGSEKKLMKKPVPKPVYHKTYYPTYEYEDFAPKPKEYGIYHSPDEEKEYKPIYEPPVEKIKPPEVKHESPDEKYKHLTGGQLYNLFVATKGLGIRISPHKKWEGDEFKQFMLAKFKEHGIY